MTLTMLALAARAATPDIDEPLRTGSSAPLDAAVVVGLEDYAYVADVPFATRDAQAFRDFLVYSRGIPLDRVRHLRTASAKMIERSVAEAAAEVGPGGTLWFYYAGHGAAAASDGSRLLLADDVRRDPAVFEDSAVRVRSLQEIASSAGVRAVLVLDTCYSGLGRSGDELVEGKRFAVPSYAVVAPPGIEVWTAASGNELSGALDPVRHGVFTYFVVGALRGWADGELTGARDGSVTGAEAQAYVSRALRSIGERSQTPTLEGGGETALALEARESGPSLADFTISVARRPDPVPSSRRSLIVPGLIVVGLGAAAGAGSWAVSLGEAPPPRSSVVPLKVANMVGWSLASVGAGITAYATFSRPQHPIRQVMLSPAGDVLLYGTFR